MESGRTGLHPPGPLRCLLPRPALCGINGSRLGHRPAGHRLSLPLDHAARRQPHRLRHGPDPLAASGTRPRHPRPPPFRWSGCRLGPALRLRLGPALLLLRGAPHALLVPAGLVPRRAARLLAPTYPQHLHGPAAHPAAGSPRPGAEHARQPSSGSHRHVRRTRMGRCTALLAHCQRTLPQAAARPLQPHLHRRRTGAADRAGPALPRPLAPTPTRGRSRSAAAVGKRDLAPLAAGGAASRPRGHSDAGAGYQWPRRRATTQACAVCCPSSP
jgi:hypothetical protein